MQYNTILNLCVFFIASLSLSLSLLYSSPSFLLRHLVIIIVVQSSSSFACVGYYYETMYVYDLRRLVSSRLVSSRLLSISLVIQPN